MDDIPEIVDDQSEDREMFEHYRFTVDKGQGLLRIDKYLMLRIENASRNKIQAAAKAGNILVNGEPVKPSYRVKPLDDISIVLPEPPRITEIFPQDIPIEIVYEDKDLLIVNKAAGMVVHPGYNNYDSTLLNALLFHLNPEGDPEADQPLLVHRIDKDTTGLLLVTKNDAAQTMIARQFFDHSIERTYTALVWGDPPEEGRIEGHIGRSLKDRRVMTVFPDGAYGKEAVTHYRVLERLGYVTLIECKLETGRTHQIRAHLKYIGHPLFGDPTYGGDKVLFGTTFTKYQQFIRNCFSLLPRQALHARTLGFVHPSSGESIRFESSLPRDIEMVLEKWRRYTGQDPDL